MTFSRQTQPRTKVMRINTPEIIIEPSQPEQTQPLIETWEVTGLSPVTRRRLLSRTRRLHNHISNGGKVVATRKTIDVQDSVTVAVHEYRLPQA